VHVCAYASVCVRVCTCTVVCSCLGTRAICGGSQGAWAQWKQCVVHLNYDQIPTTCNTSTHSAASTSALPSIPPKHPDILRKKPEILSNEPFGAPKEPSIASNKAHILSEEPCILSKQPGILPKQPIIPSNEAYTLKTEPVHRTQSALSAPTANLTVTTPPCPDNAMHGGRAHSGPSWFIKHTSCVCSGTQNVCWLNGSVCWRTLVLKEGAEARRCEGLGENGGVVGGGVEEKGQAETAEAETSSHVSCWTSSSPDCVDYDD